MARALPKLDKGRPFATVLPPTDLGVAFKQGKGDNAYSFNANGECVVAALTDAQKERHFGKGADDETLIGSGVQPSTVALNDSVSMALGDIVARAHRDSGVTVAEWNGLAQDERERLIQATIDDLRAVLKPAAPAVRKSVVGTVEENVAPAEKKEPEKFAPITPPDPVIPETPGEKAVDLRAWHDGKAQYANQEVIAEIKKRYGRGLRTVAQARAYLKEEQGY